jgi:hypothetical protein
MEDALEASPLAMAVRELLEEQESWDGTPSELLVVLGDRVALKVRQARNWPKAANRLSSELNRLAPALRSIGIHVDRSTHHRSRKITIRKCDNSSLPSSQLSRTSDNEPSRRDDPDRRNDSNHYRDDSLERRTGAACEGRNDGDEHFPEYSGSIFRHEDATDPNATQGAVAETGRERVVSTRRPVGLI